MPHVMHTQIITLFHTTVSLKEGGGGGLTGPQLLEWGCWEREGWLFSGGSCNFHLKNKFKYLMTEKVYKQKYFSLS